MSKNINEIRMEIDDLDKRIKELFLMRMSLSKDVAEYKHSNNLPIEDLIRENEIILKNSSNIDPDLKKYYIDFCREIFFLSKKYQNEIISSKR